jgi:hypothetical protein
VSEKQISLGLFGTYVLMSLILALWVGSESLPVDSSVPFLVAFSFATVFGWLAYASTNMHGAKSKSAIEVVVARLIAITLISTPVILMIYTMYAVFFWSSLLVFGVLTVTSSLEKSGATKGRDKLLSALFGTWLVVGTIVTLGRFSFLPYAQSAISLGSLDIFLEIRFIVTMATLTVLVSNSMIDAYRGPAIRVPSLPDLTLDPSADNGIAQTINTVLNSLLTVLQKVTNGIWYILVHVYTFLYRTGVSIADHLLELLRNVDLWRGIVRVLASFFALVILSLLLIVLCRGTAEYLQHDTSLFAISFADLATLLFDCFVFVSTAAIIIGIAWLWEWLPEGPTRALFAGAVVLLGSALAALIAWALAIPSTVEVPGFESLGVYTLGNLLIVISGLVYQLARAIGKKRDAEPVEP